MSLGEMLDQFTEQALEGGLLYHEAEREFRRRLLTGALRRHRGHQVRTARALGIHRNTLRQHLQQAGIAARAFRPVRRKPPRAAALPPPASEASA